MALKRKISFSHWLAQNGDKITLPFTHDDVTFRKQHDAAAIKKSTGHPTLKPQYVRA